jgi:hypothetical protein
MPSAAAAVAVGDQIGCLILRKIFAATAIASGALVVGLIILATVWGSPDPGPRGDRNPSVIVYAGLGGAIALLTTALALWGWSSAIIKRSQVVARENPKAFVFVAQKTSLTESQLSDLTQRGSVTIPHHLIIGVGRREVGVWGLNVSAPLTVFPRGAIQGVDIVDSFNGRLLPAIEIAIALSAEEVRKLSFVPCRAGWEAFPIVDRAQTAIVANRFLE